MSKDIFEQIKEARKEFAKHFGGKELSEILDKHRSIMNKKITIDVRKVRAWLLKEGYDDTSCSLQEFIWFMYGKEASRYFGTYILES